MDGAKVGGRLESIFNSGIVKIRRKRNGGARAPWIPSDLQTIKVLQRPFSASRHASGIPEYSENLLPHLGGIILNSVSAIFEAPAFESTLFPSCFQLFCGCVKVM